MKLRVKLVELVHDPTAVSKAHSDENWPTASSDVKLPWLPTRVSRGMGATLQSSASQILVQRSLRSPLTSEKVKFHPGQRASPAIRN